MELNHGTQVLPTLPGSSDFQPGDVKVLFLSFRTFNSIEEFRQNHLMKWAEAFPDDKRMVVLHQHDASPKPIHEIQEEVRRWKNQPKPEFGYLFVVLMPYVEARTRLRFGDWHYLVTQTHNHFVVENLDEGDGAPEVINERGPELFATDVVDRTKAVGTRPPAKLRIIVTGPVCSGKTLVLAAIHRQLAALWPNIPIEATPLDGLGSLLRAFERLDENNIKIPAESFELAEQNVAHPGRR